MKSSKRRGNWAVLFEGIVADLNAAEKSGDVAEQECLHAELGGFAYHAEDPIVRKAAARLVNREMADVSIYRGFVEEIAQIESGAIASSADELQRMYTDFAEFGNETTNPAVRALVAEALTRRRNAA